MASISYLSQTSSNTGSTAYTFSGRSLGAAQEDRQIIVGVSGRASGTNKNIVSVTVGGVNATKLAGYINNTSSTTESSIWIADVPTGTTGDVVVTHNSDYVRVGIALWRVTGGVEKVGYSGFSTSGTVAGPPLVTLNGGVAVGMAVGNGTGSVTWTGLTESFDAVYGSTNTTTHSGATFSTSGSTVTPRANIGGSTNVLATTVVVLVPKDSVTNRFLAASGNWNDPGVWSLRFGSPTGAPAPVANNSVFMGANFTVTLTADAECSEVFHNNGTLSLGSSKLTTRLGLTSGGDIARTINLGSGVLSITEPVVSSNGIVLWGSNLTLLSGSSLVELNIPYDDQAVSFDVQSRTFNDVRINMGQGTNNSTALNIAGSPTFRSLTIQSKNSEAHVVEFDGGATITVDKFIAIGSTPIELLDLNSKGSWQNPTSLVVSEEGSIYAQKIFARNFNNINDSKVPGYVGDDSGFLSATGWLRQDPPEISTLVDDFTKMSDDSEIDINWSKEVSGLGDIFLSGSDGVIVFAFGTNAVSRLVSKDTYDVVSQYLYIRGLSGQAGRVGIFVPYQDNPIGPFPIIEGPGDYRVRFAGTTVVIDKLNSGVWEYHDEHPVPDAYQGEELWRSVRVGARVSTSNPAQSLAMQSIGVGDEPSSSGNFLAFFTP